jgi:hypothetical protein
VGGSNGVNGGKVFVFLAALPLMVPACTDSGGRESFEIEEVYGRDAAVQFSVGVSKGSISTAETVVLMLEIRAAEHWNVEFPEIPDPLGQFEVIERMGEDRHLDRQGNLIARRRYVLEPFLPGRYAIPALEVRFGTGGDYPFSLSSEELAVEVSSVLPPQLGRQDIEEIAGPLGMRSRRIFWYGSGFGLAAGLAAAGVVLLRRRRSEGQPVGKTPREAAMQELDALLGLGLVEAGRFRELYEGLSNLVRRYIEGAFGIRARELTTEEFLQQAKSSPALAARREALAQFLAHCDLVKFARYRPSAEEMRGAVSSCRDFLSATTAEAAAG